ncbi:9775_t:CDS:2 [Entrophospora sp. SA101]|nr:9775_t:CDS:2 [Entrophospora sp. SA101]
MEFIVEKRIQQQQRGQICDSCDQQNHFHKEIIACSECGYPEPKVDNLYHIAVEVIDESDEDEEDDDENEKDEKQEKEMEFSKCPRCNKLLKKFLKLYKTYNNRYSRVYDIARLSILGSLNDM